MAILNGIVTVLLVITALILIATVLLQPGESNGLGAIAGGAETFFGKNKAKSMEGKLALATKVSAGVFIICALIVGLFFEQFEILNNLKIWIERRPEQAR